MPCETRETALCLHLLHNSQKQENCALFYASAINRKITTSNIHLLKHSRLAHTLFCLPQPQHGPTSSKSHKLEPYLMPHQEETQNWTCQLQNLTERGGGVYISHTWIYPGYLNQYEVHWWRELNLQAAILSFPWNTENTQRAVRVCLAKLVVPELYYPHKSWHSGASSKIPSILFLGLCCASPKETEDAALLGLHLFFPSSCLHSNDDIIISITLSMQGCQVLRVTYQKWKQNSQEGDSGDKESACHARERTREQTPRTHPQKGQAGRHGDVPATTALGRGGFPRTG